MQFRPKSPFQAICPLQSQMCLPGEWLQFPDLNTWLFKIHLKDSWSSVSTISQRKRMRDTMVKSQTSIWITDSLTPLKFSSRQVQRTVQRMPRQLTSCREVSRNYYAWETAKNTGNLDLRVEDPGNGDQFAKHSSETSSLTKLASSVKWYGTRLESLNAWTFPSNFDVVRMYKRKSSVKWQPLQFGPHRLSHLDRQMMDGIDWSVVWQPYAPSRYQCVWLTFQILWGRISLAICFLF